MKVSDDMERRAWEWSDQAGLFPVPWRVHALATLLRTIRREALEEAADCLAHTVDDEAAIARHDGLDEEGLILTLADEIRSLIAKEQQ